jgi:hypothetical protein
MKGIKDIRYDIGVAHGWLADVREALYWDAADSRSLAKRRLQKAKALIDEAIADLDGLIQDAKNEADGIDPEYEAWQAARCGGCPQCGDDGEA